VWHDICVIHECRAGLQPIQCSAIKKSDGEMFVGPGDFVQMERAL